MTVALGEVLDELSERTKRKFEHPPKVVVKDDDFDVTDLPIGPTWHRISDVVAVVFDMKSSTNLERGRTPASTASIYDAGVGGVVRILNTFKADFVDIQGDGGFGLFWGASRYERAMCAGISVRTFSEDFAAQLLKKWKDAPSTGFKVGIASGPVLAKKVGLERHLDLQEPVWAGRSVNFATKAAQQQTTAEHMIVTASVWDSISDNDYLTFSCGCRNGQPGFPPSALWENVEIDKIPGPERYGQMLESLWCGTHGDEFCNAVLDGQRFRAGIEMAERSKRTHLGLSTTERVAAEPLRAEYRRQLKEGAEASRRAQLAALRN